MEEDSGYFDIKFKILVFGESTSNKASLIRRYTKDQFGGIYLNTVGIDFQDKLIQIEDKKVKLQIWDTAGQERFRNVAKNYFQNTQGFVLVYNITDRQSFEKLSFWLEQIKLNASEKVKIVLVGNNCDLANERKVSIEEAEEFAKKNNMKFFEASPKEGTNVNELFYYLANEIYQEGKPFDKKEEKTLKLSKDAKKKKKKICLIL